MLTGSTFMVMRVADCPPHLRGSSGVARKTLVGLQRRILQWEQLLAMASSASRQAHTRRILAGPPRRLRCVRAPTTGGCRRRSPTGWSLPGLALRLTAQPTSTTCSSRRPLFHPHHRRHLHCRPQARLRRSCSRAAISSMIPSSPLGQCTCSTAPCMSKPARR